MINQSTKLKSSFQTPPKDSKFAFISLSLSYLLTAIFILQSCQCADDDAYDLVIYGSTSAGIIAASHACQHMNRIALLSEPGESFGGMTTSGLSFTDFGNKQSIGGLAREFYSQIKQYYDSPSSWQHEAAETYKYYDPSADMMLVFEPHVAKQIFQKFLADCPNNVDLYSGYLAGVQQHNNIISSISTHSGTAINGKTFIDASYEGQLMAQSGVSFTVGRESVSKYGERFNGIQRRRNFHNHRFLVDVDPYIEPGDPNSGLVFGVSQDSILPNGATDQNVQAYCFRMCLTDVSENQVPFQKPEMYSEDHYELLFRNFEAGDLRIPFYSLPIPNRKTDTNTFGAVSTDFIFGNQGYATAVSPATRQAIVESHRRYQQGLMWTLAHHTRVPPAVRETVSTLGYCKDEFEESEHFSPSLYIREARRMVGSYVLNEHDCLGNRVSTRPIAMGSYTMDSHNVRRYIDEEGHVRNEGDVQIAVPHPYPIDYGVIIPKPGETKNLWVPVAASASHIAYGSIRMEPVFMMLAQSAAIAATIAIDTGDSAQSIDYNQLRTELLKANQILEFSVAE